MSAVAHLEGRPVLFVALCALCAMLLAGCGGDDGGGDPDVASGDTAAADDTASPDGGDDTSEPADTASDVVTDAFDPSTVTVPTTPGQHVVAFEHGGVERGFALLVSRDVQAGAPAPLAVILHGSGESAAAFMELHPSLLQQLDAQGYVAVFPTALFNDATGRTNWNVSEDPALADDERFVLDIIELLEAHFELDPARHYAAGFSNGGQLMHRIAGRNPQVFAAIAAISTSVGRSAEPGGPVVYFASPDGPRGPVPVLIANGKLDTQIVWEGEIDQAGYAQSSVQDAVDLYLGANGCDPTPVTTWPVADEVFVDTYDQNCTDGAPVVLVGLERMEHIWPDPADGLGWDASSGALEFFAAH